MTLKTLHGYRRAVRRKAFRRFWLGMMISRAGDAFTIVALSWVVLGLAGPVQLGVVLMCFGLPRIVSGPAAGRLLARSRPHLALAADNAARGLLIAAVPVLLWQHRLAVADLYAIAAVSALLGVVAGPGLSGRLPPPARLGAVIGAGAALFGLLRLAPDLAAAAVLLGLATFAWGPYYVVERTLVQRLVPDEARSRVAGARMTISSLGFPLGSAFGGMLAGAFGAPAVVLVVACSGLVVALLAARARTTMPAPRQTADPGAGRRNARPVRHIRW